MKFTANPPGVDAPVVDGGSTLVKDRRSPFLYILKEGRHWIHISIVFSIPYNDENEVVLEFKTSRKLLSWWNQSCFWAHTSVSEPNARHTPTSQQGNFSLSPTTCNVDSTTICTFQPLCLVAGVHGEITPLSSWKPRANKRNLLFLSCITKMGQTFINFFSWVDIHGIYYIVKFDNQIW